MKNIIVKLVKIANDMDAMGMHDEADEITSVAKEMQEDGEREAAGIALRQGEMDQPGRGGQPRWIAASHSPPGR